MHTVVLLGTDILFLCMKVDRKGSIRFLKYASVGGSTFLFDLFMLYVLVSILQVNYIIATGVAFFIAVSVNYICSRRLVFQKTETVYYRGYITFMAAASVGIIVTMAGMYMLVGSFGMYYIFARFLVSLFVGMSNYLFNLYFNFKVSGVH